MHKYAYFRFILAIRSRVPYYYLRGFKMQLSVDFPRQRKILSHEFSLGGVHRQTSLTQSILWENSCKERTSKKPG